MCHGQKNKSNNRYGERHKNASPYKREKKRIDIYDQDDDYAVDYNYKHF